MDLTFKIYYDEEGIIKMLTTEALPGKHIIVSEKDFIKITDNPSKYIVQDGKVDEIKKIRYPAPEIKFSDTFKLGKDGKCYVVHKNNLFYCVDSVTIKPSWFDPDKHSWAVYDS